MTRAKRRNTDIKVVNKVSDYLLDNPNYTGKELKRLVEKDPELMKLKIHYDFTPRTYQNIKKDLGEPIRALDKPWSLGTLKQHDISPQSINKVISIQSLLTDNEKFLTIRRGKWIDRLNPILSPLLEGSDEKLNKVEQDLILLQVSSFYTRSEQISEISKENYADTRELDRIFIFNKQLSFESILGEWMNLFLPHVPLKEERSKTKEQDKMALEVEEQPALLRQFKSILVKLDDDKNKLAQAIILVKQHPELRTTVLKWMATSTRSEIEEWAQENKINKEQGG